MFHPANAARRLAKLLTLGVVLTAAAAPAPAQARIAAQEESRAGPRFLAIADHGTRSGARAWRDAAEDAVFQERISVHLDGARLDEALGEIAGQAGLRLTYSSSVVRLDRPVTLVAADITVGAALSALLYDAGVDVLLTSPRQAALVQHVGLARQPGTIEGTVLGARAAGDPPQPVAAAQVTVEGTRLGALTDARGRFRIAGVPAGPRTVTVSSIGWHRQSRQIEVAEAATTTVDFTLDAAPSALTEVVATVTGEQRRVELGHVLARIDADSIARHAPITSVTDLLSGRAAGVQVLHQSGLAGSTPRIRIRGLNSAAVSNDPIVIIDGVRFDNSTGPSTGTGNALRGGRFNDLSPDEIQSIEIAKGPSAATLYGTDAANGVIVVTTKRGRAGPARWRMWSEQGRSSKALDAFPENYIGWGHTAADPTPRRCTIQQLATGVCAAIDSVGHFNPLNHPETTPFTSAHRQDYGLQVSGGSDRLTYLFSGQLTDEDGYVRMPVAEAERFESIHGPGTLLDDFRRPNGVQRTSLRANVTAALDDRTELDARVNFLRNHSLFVADQSGAGVITSAVRGPGFRDAQNGYGGAAPPAVTFATRRAEDVDRFVGSLTARWAPRGWLDTRATAGIDHISSDREALSRTNEGELSQGAFDQALLRVTGLTADLGATARAPLSAHWTSSTSAGVQYTRRDETQLYSRALGLPPGGKGPGGATSVTMFNLRDESYVLGGYVQQQLSLNGRLFLIGAVRGDGGSAFGEDVNLAVYPKASVSWLVSEEPFMPRSQALSNLRLRAAWGASGVQPQRQHVVPSLTYTTAIVDGQVVSAARLNQIGNPDLRPERQRELEVGFDLELFGDRASIEGTFYDRVSHDALVSVQMPPSHGSFSRFENLGSVQNRGIEGAVRLALLDTRPLRWEVGVSGSRNSNELLELAAGFTDLPSPASRHRHVVGYPLWGLWEREYTYSDADGDGLITPAEIELGDTVFVGSSLPTRELAVANTFSLLDGRVRVGAQLDYRGGHKRMDNNESLRCSPQVSSCRGVSDPSAPLELQAEAAATLRSVVPIRDASFTRLREVSVTYTADPSVSRFLGGRQLSVTLGGRNLALWSDYPGDPEAVTALFSTVGADAFSDNGAFPQARSWLLRVQLGN